MSTKETNEPVTPSMAGTDGPTIECPPGTHFDPEIGACVPDGGGEEISAATTSESANQAEEK